MSFNAWGNGYVYWDGYAWPIGGTTNNGYYVTGMSVNGIPICLGTYIAGGRPGAETYKWGHVYCD